MTKITIEKEGKEPKVIECEQYILRADNGESTVMKGDHNISFLAASAMYFNELARIKLVNQIKGE